MTQEPTDGTPAVPLTGKYRGFRIVVRFEGVSFIARAITSLAATSTRPTGEREVHEQDIAMSVIDAECAMQMAKDRIDQLYDLEAQMVEQGAAHQRGEA